VSLFGLRRHPGAAQLSVESRLPGFDGATGWLNSPTLGPADLTGNVVLVDFWTYTCINWLRTLGYVRAWADKYGDRGLIVVGVHTPEFPFERDVDNVRTAAAAMRVEYPIALDSDYAVWRAFTNMYWPAVYIADEQGRIRYHHFGEGDYDECEWVVQQLLGEAGREDVGDELVDLTPAGYEAQADWANLGSPETYLGYEQGESFASPGEAKIDRTTSYTVPGSLRLNTWALSGDWRIGSRASVLDGSEGQIVFRFHARDVNLVMGPVSKDAAVPFRIRVDGEPPGDAHGIDVEANGNGLVAEQRLYQLLREPGAITDRTFEITFLAPAVEAYVFTFG
jgi:thiol-disulfide isomerase/thioredoxin